MKRIKHQQVKKVVISAEALLKAKLLAKAPVRQNAHLQIKFIPKALFEAK